MAKDIGITLFDLKTSPSFIVVAGGGGDPLYGMKNGVAVIDKNELDSEKDIVFYKTEDFIKAVHVYAENTPCEDFEEDDVSYEHNPEADSDIESTSTHSLASLTNERPSEQDTVNKSSTINKKHNSVDQDNSKITENKDIGKEVDDEPGIQKIISLENEINSHKSSDKQPSNSGTVHSQFSDTPAKETIYIAAIGESFFYLLKFDGSVKTLIKSKCKVKVAHLSKHLLLLSNHTVSHSHGFYDIVNHSKRFNISHQKMNLDNSDDEEYFYSLYKRKGRIIYKREFGTDDITDDWDNLFVHNNRIHKILYNDDVSTLVFNNKKYSYSGKIPKVLVINDSLVFYTVKDSISLLYFLGNSERVFQLPKITCISSTDNTVIVATSTGDCIVYVNQIFYSKTHLSELPITGISIKGNIAYFSVITGLVSLIKIKKSRYYYGFVMAVIAIIIGLILAYFKK